MSNVVPLPADRRRVDTFDRARWLWAEAVARSTLPPLAKVLAYVLITQFAHRETADCHPGWIALADAVNTSPRTIRRVIAEMEAAGFLARGPGGYSGKKVAILFRIEGQGIVGVIDKVAGNVHQKAVSNGHQKAAGIDPQKAASNGHQSDPERWPDMTGKVAIPDQPPCTPHIDKPNSNQRGGGPESASQADVFWAEKIRGSGYVAASAVNPVAARRMLAAGLVSAADLDRRGITH